MSQLKDRQRITNDDTNQVNQVSDGKDESVVVDIGSLNLTSANTSDIGRYGKYLYSINELVGIQHSVSDLVPHAIQVEISAGVEII